MDQKLLFLINGDWTHPALDRLMAIASSAALWAVPLGIAALWALVRGGFRGRVFVAVALVAFGLTDGVAGRLLKKSIGRHRPHQVVAGVRTVDLAAPAWRGVFSPLKVNVSRGDKAHEEGRSFPSNHAANTAAVALIVSLLWRCGWLAFLPALLVAYSRVYIGAHWPGDVLAGICVGVAVASFTFVLAEIAWRRWGPRFAARAAAAHPSLLGA